MFTKAGLKISLFSSVRSKFYIFDKQQLNIIQHEIPSDRQAIIHQEP